MAEREKGLLICLAIALVGSGALGCGGIKMNDDDTSYLMGDALDRAAKSHIGSEYKPRAPQPSMSHVQKSAAKTQVWPAPSKQAAAKKKPVPPPPVVIKTPPPKIGC